MKHLLVLSTLLASSAFAQGVRPSVDYQQCQRAIGFMGPQLNSFGEFDREATGMLPAPDIDTKKTEDGGSRITYTYKSEGGPWNKGKPIVSVYSIEKDKDGNLKKIISGGEKMDSHQVKMHKQMLLESAVYTGVPMGGLSNDPVVTVSLSNKGYYFTPLSKLDKGEAKKFGVDMDELRKLRSEKRKDDRVLKKLRDGYTKLFDKAPLMIPNGQEAEVEIKDGACVLNKVATRLYDPKSKETQIGSGVNRERCEGVNKISKKYEKQLQACANTNFQMSQEMYALNNPTAGVQGGMVGGIQGGQQQGGGTTSGNVYPGTGGGYVGGIQGGYIGGGYIGGGYGGMGMPMNDTWECQAYFGEFQQGGYGQSGSSAKNVKKSVKASGTSVAQ